MTIAKYRPTRPVRSPRSRNGHGHPERFEPVTLREDPQRRLGRATLAQPSIEVQRELRAPEVYRTELNGSGVDLTGRKPILSREAVIERFGVDLGPLLAEVRLPGKQSMVHGRGSRYIPVYIFDPAGGRGRHAAVESPYYLMGLEDIARARDTGGKGLGMGHPLARQPGQSVAVGREHWLPNLGYATEQLDADPRGLGNTYGAIDRVHAAIGIAPGGGITVHDYGTYNGTVVYYGAPNHLAPVDWQATVPLTPAR